MTGQMKALAAATAAMLALATPLMAQDAGEPQAGGTLNMVIQPEPPGLMIGLIQNGPTQMVAGQIYESLLRYDENLEPMPGLAKEWTIVGRRPDLYVQAARGCPLA